MGVGGQHHALATLIPGKKYSTHRTGGSVGSRAGLDRCRKFCQHEDLIPRPSSPWQVSIPTTLSQPTQKTCYVLPNSASFRERQVVCAFPVRCSGSPHELVCQVQGEPHWWRRDTTEVNACHLPSSNAFCLVVGYFSIGPTVTVLEIIWWLSLPETLHLLLQLLPSRRPADLDILYIQRMYLIKRFTDIEVYWWRVRRITGLVRESTLGSVELRQASFSDRTGKSTWQIATCLPKFNVLLTVHHATILGNCPTRCTNYFQCIYLFIVLYMFRASHTHHQEKQIVSIQLLVIVTPCWWQCRVLVGSKFQNSTRHQHGVTFTRSCIDTICFSWWWAWHARNM